MSSKTFFNTFHRYQNLALRNLWCNQYYPKSFAVFVPGEVVGELNGRIALLGDQAEPLLALILILARVFYRLLDHGFQDPGDNLKRESVSIETQP